MVEENHNRIRVGGVIIKDGKILLMERIKPNTEYFVLPGGGMEVGEDIETALRREIKEELNFDILDWQPFITLENEFQEAYGGRHGGNQAEHYFLIKNYSGEMKVGGPEKEKMNDQNIYQPVWMDLSKIKDLQNLYPKNLSKIICSKLSLQ
jgi:ADP-ribose pyrophosphatase YjhB (NUDIX family)